MNGAGAPAPLERFRAAVMADPRLQLELSRSYDPAAFVELALARAGECGIVLDAGALRAELRPDPLGLSRWAVRALAERWPEGDWLPVHLGVQGAPYVDWAHFGGAPLTDPFFEGAVLRALAQPFNQAFRQRMSVDRFVAEAAGREAHTPRGLIFHMSRCGSTLVSQMLAALPRSTVVSEAPAIDDALQLQSAPGLSQPYAGLLPALASALGRPRLGEPRDLFIKLDSWHAMALPRFRRAFPSTPWVFLYRDPLEVMVSQQRQAGLQAVPGVLAAHIVGFESEGMAGDDYCARVLSRACEAAADQCGADGGLLVNYDELPDAVLTRILPHFGVAFDAADRAAMLAAAGRDAKAPDAAFRPDGEAKRREATPRLVELVERRMTPAYRRLEALRAAQAQGAP
jgi:hypothetical protein